MKQRQVHQLSFMAWGLLIVCLGQPALAQDAEPEAEAQIRARFEEFNRAWERRDIDFVRGYYAHDPGMLLFFERRQLRGWSRVETLYENMFAHASGGKVESTYSNLDVGARGDLGYVAANFHLQVTNPAGDTMTDEGRQTVVFERRDGRWVVIHRHTSFQAPPGPQREVPLHTEPGPLWSPNLEGAWRGERTAMLLATRSHLSFLGAPGMPTGARYRREGDSIFMEPLPGHSSPPPELELLELSSAQLRFRVPGREEVWVWTRIE